MRKRIAPAEPRVERDGAEQVVELGALAIAVEAAEPTAEVEDEDAVEEGMLPLTAGSASIMGVGT